MLEQEACDRYGVKQVRFVVTALEAPSREQVLGAKRLFDEIEYPAMMHCKSGADRAGMMSALYMHFRLKKPISEAMSQLDFLKFGHVRFLPEGVLDYCFEKYLKEAEPLGDFLRGLGSQPRLRSRHDQAGVQGDTLARFAAGKTVLARVLTVRPDRPEMHARIARRLGARPLALRPPHRT